MNPPAGKLARFWRNDRVELAHAFQEKIVFENPLNRKIIKEPHRG